MKKILSVVLFLSAIMPFFLGLSSLMRYKDVLAMLDLNDSPDVFQLVTIAGTYLICFAAVEGIAGYWTWKENPFGILLARALAILLLASGIVLYFLLQRTDISLPNIFRGALILLLSFIAEREGKSSKLSGISS